MPNIKLVNIRFRLDGERDKEIHDALFRHPDGARNRVIKDALYNYLIDKGETGGASTIKPRRRSTCSGERRAIEQEGADTWRPGIEKEKTLVTPEQSSTSVKNIQPSDVLSEHGKEEDNIVAGLRSMIQ